ncbi:hypothetical protein VSDG_05205 [Cytospora chrysosperma]|uniref:ATP-dependent DNA helicase n=1 Tax=Cytospora chrysosperma TaxID=252740 RepID=A0A423VXK5_CYTCH|nr:hypothetical protein VSDG_05205 [Valsa sordida]
MLGYSGYAVTADSSNTSSSKPSEAPLFKERPFWTEEWLKNKQTFDELNERQEVLGNPPAAPTRGGRLEDCKNRVVEDLGEATLWDKCISGEPSEYNGPRLSPEQARVVELAAQGRNIFYTGSAGCGKSTVLRAIAQRLRALGKHVCVMAPTGKAALAINGTTTWTFAGWTLNTRKVSLAKLKKAAAELSDKKLSEYERFQRTDVIIIDEISMVENVHFERLNQFMKEARRKTGRAARWLPFGGVQVIVTGDFAQLPPVRPFEHCYKCGSEIQLDVMQKTHNCLLCKVSYPAVDQWAFRSKAWEECNFAHVHLKTIHRQRDDIFISMLQKCRLGDPFTPEEIDLLMNHESETTGAVELYSTREEVRAVNEREFRKLSTTPHSFKCHDTFIWNEHDHPQLAINRKRHPDGWLTYLRDHRLDHQVELKTGMPVVLLANLNLDKGLCNGSQGEIIGWTAPPRSTPDEAAGRATYGAGAGSYAALKQAQIAAFEKEVDPAVWPIVRFTNGVQCTICAECVVNELGDEKPYSLICRTQIPLTPAWALSIHKAQGMTLDRVKVDLSRAFSEGQVYVALSRATSLQGLKVVGDPKGLMVGRGGNREVRAFYREKFGL